MRVSRLVSASNWRYAMGEIALIVVGVSIALAASSWYENRQLRDDEYAVLAELQVTLQEDLDSVTIAYTTIHRVDQEIASFVDRVESDHLTSAETTAGIGWTMRFVTLNIRFGPYETLKARGINLITNQSLRVNLTSLYEDEIPNLVEDSVIDRRLSRDRILPYILRVFWLDASEHWIPKQTPVANWQSDLATLGRYRARTFTDHYLPSFEHTMDFQATTL